MIKFKRKDVKYSNIEDLILIFESKKLEVGLANYHQNQWGFHL